MEPEEHGDATENGQQRTELADQARQLLNEYNDPTVDIQSAHKLLASRAPSLLTKMANELDRNAEPA